MIRLCLLIACGMLLFSCNPKVPKQEISPASESPYTWQTTDTTLAVLTGDTPIWQFNYGKSAGKPYFYPLALTDGTPLTAMRPDDHVWHKSLWYSWKYINRVNYWEEPLEGITEVTAAETVAHDDFSADITLQLSYYPVGGDAIVQENRRIHVGAPTDSGSYAIDWTFEFQNLSDSAITFDRTPIEGQENGKVWGGYTGLTVRFRKDLTDWHVENSDGLTGEATHGQAAKWVEFTGTLPDGQKGAFRMIDDANNPRHPNEWVVHCWPHDNYYFMTTGFIYSRPFTLSANETLTLKYTTVVFPKDD